MKKNRKTISIIAISIGIIGLVLILIFFIIIPAKEYKFAVEHYGIETANEIKSLKKGDSYYFGKFKQCSDYDSEPLEWIVLDKSNSGLNVVLITNNIIDDFNSKGLDTFEAKDVDTLNLKAEKIKSFADTNLSKMLNKNNYIKFTSNEKKMIAQNFSDKEETGAITLLSNDEVRKYFPSEKSRKCERTKRLTDKYEGSAWMLRDMNFELISDKNEYMYEILYSYIDNDGKINEYGFAPIRPVIRIDLTKEN